MPFLPQNPFDEEDKKKLAAQGTNISGASGTFSLPGASQNANAPKPVDSSGSFANLNSYLDANRDNAQGMASNIAGSVDTAAQDANDKIDSFKSAGPQSTARLSNDSLKTDYFDNATSLDDASKSQYSTLKQTGGYSGPNSVSGVAGMQDAVTANEKATTKLQQTGTETGRQQLLKDQFGRPSYTQGQNLLDQSLIQRDPTSQQTIKDVSSKWSSLNGMLDGAVNQTGNTIQSNLQNALDNKAQIDQSEQQYMAGFSNPITERATNLRTTAPQLQQALGADIQDRNLTQDTIDRLGLGQYVGQSLYNTNLSSYLTNNDASGVNENTVATQDERAKYAALASLMGRDATLLGSEQQSFSPVTFNSTQFATDRAAQQAAMTADKNVLKNEYLTNPNATGGYAAMIPWNKVDASRQGVDKILNATPEELKNYWFPLMDAQAKSTGYASERQNADAIMKSVNDWEKFHGINNILNKT